MCLVVAGLEVVVVIYWWNMDMILLIWGIFYCCFCVCVSVCKLKHKLDRQYRYMFGELMLKIKCFPGQVEGYTQRSYCHIDT